MGHYKSNLRDIEFTLFELLRIQDRLGSEPFGEVDEETARGILVEVERLAAGPVAESLLDSDRNPPVFDPQTHSARLPESFKKSFRAYMDAEWWRMQIPAEIGGTVVPASLRWAAEEMVLGANPAVHMYASGMSFSTLLYVIGTEDQKKWARWMVDKRWASTMILTEPDAGSDVGAGRTKAIEQPDGSWHIEGVKRFITSGDHDLTDNIVHFVLARPAGAGPGTKGLSMFMVPKFHADLETGELGERNGVFVTNVEKKMGLKVSTTCEVRFGEDPARPAVGWLVGGVHDGIRQMFKIIESARMMVGTKAIATLSTGYLNALEFAKTRVQSADLTQMADKAAPRVTILHHPDVRRMLMLQKAYAEGMRALALYTATQQDAIMADPYRRGRGAAQRPAAAVGQGPRLGAVVRAAVPVAAGLRRLRLPAGLPDRAIPAGREDRHPVRGDHLDPGPRPVLPQDRPGQGDGADRAGHRDRHVRRRARPATVG